MSGIQKQQQSKQTQAKSNAKKAPEQAKQSVNLEQLVEAPETMLPDQILAAQKQVGNQTVQRALDSQKKREAMTDEQGYLKGEINNAIQSKRGGGSSLPDSVREVANKNLKHDFSDVRIHTDEKANELSQSINARAFTIGKDIFFKKGVFAPGSKQGRETIMHELTHVVQQSGSSSGASGKLKLGAPDTSHEKQADQVGKANSSVDSVSSASNSAVQRIPSVGGRLAPIEEEPAVGGQNIADKAPNVGGNPAPVPEEDPVINQVKANRSQGILNTEIRGFDKSRLKSVPVAEKAPNVGGRLNPIQEAPDVGGNKDDDAVQMQPDTGVVQREPRDPVRQVDDDDNGKHQALMSDITRFNKGSLKAIPGRRNPVQDDDAVQRQPDAGVVQREEMPGDELQMQRDTSVVQREEMPEEELQMQPDPTVQRDFDIDSEERRQRKGIFETLGDDVANKDKGDVNNQIKVQQGKKRTLMDEIQGFNKKDLTKVPTKEKKDSSKGLAQVTTSEYLKENKYSKANLLKTIKDPESSTEEVKKAEKMMKTMHKNKGFKGLFKKNASAGAMEERQKSLKGLAEKGQEGAFEKYQAEKKPSKMGS